MAGDRRILMLILTGSVLIGTAGLASWFFANFERSTLEIPVGASAQARRNPFLAAERLLARLDIQAESRAGRDLLRRLPPPSDTLVVNGLSPLDPERQAALRTWIAEGGRLVVKATEIWEDEAPPNDLLGELGIGLKALDPKDCNCKTETLGEAVVTPGAPPLKIAFAAGHALALNDVDGQQVEAGGHPRLVRVPIGAGELVALSDTEFMTNGAIGERDHALFVAHLVSPPRGGKVWLVYDSALPWLGALLWAAAPGALIAAAVLIPVWLWSLGARLGPLEPPPDRRRRDLAEHLEASGAFLWRYGLASSLVEPTRKRVLAAWQRRQPELRGLPPKDQATLIARTLGEPADALTEALLTQADDRRGFADQARRLQGLWQGARPRLQAGQPTNKTHQPRSHE